jgi:hypothetical protein
MQWLAPARSGPTRIQWLAGLTTAWSIVDHAWHELRERGYFDPEVAALAYLGAALTQKKFLTASAVSWLATFGRHLIETPITGVEVRPVEVPNGDGQPGRYELVVSADSDARDRIRTGVVSAIHSVVKHAMTGGGQRDFKSLWDELRDVSRIHGAMLEGYGDVGDGVPIRFR